MVLLNMKMVKKNKLDGDKKILADGLVINGKWIIPN
jgi:hypothetical protein|tara:strand:- start:619 stop:726 length:108 start_codon:yes stop_codon:yes gene_type:complete